jgi:bifunctional non-homologous end joining protein LigD
MVSGWMARRDVAGVRLLTRNGIDWSARYPGIASVVGALNCRSCLLDGEVVICGEDGIPVFDRLRHWHCSKRRRAASSFALPSTCLFGPR